ncbi:CU044_5270 family protein [Saccharothrix longispora]|uniref:CU044_5270 family protein n=1 Tax=Saccharothrix longispora TaxID=33920 RepID=UPI0028FD5A9B|nr:CU044_5270 family protein [Saccharothrix longispora]MDU0288515.1 CU044_5270 family protein [Saccharothrix longispora]
MRELDDALDELNRDARTSDAPLDAVRARVLAAAAAESAAPKRPASRRWYLPVAVAAAAALVTGVVAVNNGSGARQVAEPPTAGTSESTAPQVHLLSAREYLTMSADAITAVDQPLAPGQYRYVAAHEWNRRGVGLPPAVGDPDPKPAGYDYLVESRTETWIPQDVTQEWLNRRTPLGGVKWLGGSVPQSEAPAPEPTDTDRGERRGRCGDFFPGSQPKKVCGDPQDWDNPDFYTGLPRDPQALAQWLRDATAHRGGAPATVFHWAVQLLRTGLVPADLRSALYRALATLDGVTVTDGNANLDGRTGVAVTIETGTEHRELIVDPATGDFIGERTVAAEAADSWIPAGTVTGYSAITTKVVNGLGETS